MRTIIFAVGILFSLDSCRQQSPEVASQPISEKDTQKVVEKKQPVFSAMKTEEISTYFTDVKGFRKNGPSSGESAHIGKSGNKYFSYARQEYIKENIVYTVEIIDYKDDSATFRGLVNMYNNLNQNQEDNTETRATIISGKRFIINGLVNDNKYRKELNKLLSGIPIDKLPKS